MKRQSSLTMQRRGGLWALCLAIPLVAQATPPQISGYAPAPLANVTQEQVLTVSGSGFVAGISASLTAPDGRTSAIAGMRVQVVSSSKLLLSLRFRVAGTYQLRLTTREGTAGPVTIPVTDAPAPVITGHLPGTVLRSDEPQLITFQGSGFRNNLSLTVAQPGGGGTTLSGLAIRSLTATQFQAEMKLDRLGGYSVYINDPDGAQSKPYNFAVVRTISKPTVTGIAPALIRAASGIQKLTLTGTGFVDGLSVPVSLPGGGTFMPAAYQVRVQSATSLQLWMEFQVEGAHRLRVVNPDSGQSEELAFTVAPPVVSSLSLNGVTPPVVTASPAGQMLTFTGKGFGVGLFAAMISPGGGVTYFGDSQIFNLTPTSFQLSVSLVSPGDYLFQAYNSTGAQTNSYKLTVNAASSAPVISLYSPLSFVLSSTPQVVTLLGRNLKPGLTATVVLPDGSGPLPVEIVAGSVRAEGLQVRLALAQEGLYTFQVTNPDGAQSAPFGVRTSVPGPSTPVLSSYAPFRLASGAEMRTLVLSGSDFVQGLTLTMTLPDGTVQEIPDSQVGSVTFGRILFNTVLSQEGEYLISLQNLDGGSAGPLSVQVSAPSAVSAITSYLPSTLRPSAATQSAAIHGSGFAPGLGLAVTAPDGATTQVAGVAIQAVTSTSFLALLNLPVAGDYTLRVVNEDGTLSEGFPLVVSPALSQPVVTSVKLAAGIPSQAPQVVSLRGTGLQPGFRVTLFGPTPNASIPSSAITFDAVAGWQFSAVFPAPFNYALRVVNPDGAMSAEYSFDVR